MLKGSQSDSFFRHARLRDPNTAFDDYVGSMRVSAVTPNETVQWYHRLQLRAQGFLGLKC